LDNIQFPPGPRLEETCCAGCGSHRIIYFAVPVHTLPAFPAPSHCCVMRTAGPVVCFVCSHCGNPRHNWGGTPPHSRCGISGCLRLPAVRIFTIRADSPARCSNAAPSMVNALRLAWWFSMCTSTSRSVSHHAAGSAGWPQWLVGKMSTDDLARPLLCNTHVAVLDRSPPFHHGFPQKPACARFFFSTAPQRQLSFSPSLAIWPLLARLFQSKPTIDSATVPVSYDLTSQRSNN